MFSIHHRCAATFGCGYRSDADAARIFCRSSVNQAWIHTSQECFSSRIGGNQRGRSAHHRPDLFTVLDCQFSPKLSLFVQVSLTLDFFLLLCINGRLDHQLSAIPNLAVARIQGVCRVDRFTVPYKAVPFGLARSPIGNHLGVDNEKGGWQTVMVGDEIAQILAVDRQVKVAKKDATGVNKIDASFASCGPYAFQVARHEIGIRSEARTTSVLAIAVTSSSLRLLVWLLEEPIVLLALLLDIIVLRKNATFRLLLAGLAGLFRVVTIVVGL